MVADVLVERLRGHPPLGITAKFEMHGIFPVAGKEYEATADPEEDGSWFPAGDEFGNYASFQENEELAVEELRKEIANGFVVWRPERESFERERDLRSGIQTTLYIMHRYAIQSISCTIYKHAIKPHDAGWVLGL